MGAGGLRSLNTKKRLSSAFLEPLVGFEPTEISLCGKGLIEGLSPHSSPDLRLLLRVVEKWPSLNGSLKLAILAIIEGS
ncbi:MAG: hypothetical protein V4689_11385 [Verrucomicrobiota bacterium]